MRDPGSIEEIPHAWELIRDIPRSCTCRSWMWFGYRWQLLERDPECAWHFASEQGLQRFHDAAMDERQVY